MDAREATAYGVTQDGERFEVVQSQSDEVAESEGEATPERRSSEDRSTPAHRHRPRDGHVPSP